MENSLSILINQSLRPTNGLTSLTEKWLPSEPCAAADPDTAKMQALCLQAINGNTIASIFRRDPDLMFGVKIDLEFCAATYCGAPNTLPETIGEGVKFILSQFSHLGLTEIREAFRLAAAGKIEADLNAFYGLFTVQMLGKVMSAYDDYRTAIFREVRAKVAQIEEQYGNEERAEAMREKFGTIADQFAALQAKNEKYERWQDLPEWFCRRVIEEDLAGVTLEEKGKAWITAKHWAANEVRTWMLDTSLSKQDRARYAAAAALLGKNPDIFPEEIKKEAQEAYSKILVHPKIAVYEKAI